VQQKAVLTATKNAVALSLTAIRSLGQVQDHPIYRLDLAMSLGVYIAWAEAGVPMTAATLERTTGVEEVEKVEAVDVVRAWTDRAYYETLSAGQRAQVPSHPGGSFDPESFLGVLTKVPVMCIDTAPGDITDPSCCTCLGHNTTNTCTF
jgi:mersacidin/lichenicidin family type 2 lantibiotic